MASGREGRRAERGLHLVVATALLGLGELSVDVGSSWLGSRRLLVSVPRSCTADRSRR